MPIAAFSHSSDPVRLGKVIGDQVVDLSVAAPELGSSIRDILTAGATALGRLERVRASDGPCFALDAVRLHIPLPDPQKYLGIGLNYADHTAEVASLGVEKPDFQKWFNKQVSCITGPFDDIVAPAVSDSLDYEGELAVVIGRRCRSVKRDEARTVIGGYMIANDVSVRDWQFRTPTVTLGKSFDTHGPLGPWLTLAEEVADPHELRIRTLVNGEIRQDGSTANLIYDTYEQIEYLSQVMTLMPGDILATGTPAGVGISFDPPRYLREDDVVRIEIDGLGHIENRVARAADPSEPRFASLKKRLKTNPSI